MERFFQILAVILAGVAAYFLWQGNADRAFVAAVFGAVSFFLSVRFQVKERLRLREAEREEEEQRSEGEEEKRREGEEEKRRRGEEEIDGEIDNEILDAEAPQLNETPAAEEFDNQQRTTDDELKAQTLRATDNEPKI